MSSKRSPIEIWWSPRGFPAWEFLSRHRDVDASDRDWNQAVRLLGVDARLKRVNSTTDEILTAHPAPEAK